MKIKWFLPVILLLLTAIYGCSVNANPPLITQSPTQMPTDETSISVDSPTVVAGNGSSGNLGTPLSLPTTETPASESKPTILGPSGKTEVTLEDSGKVFSLSVGESFLLKLGEGYDWQVESSDQTILDRVKNIAVVRGAQGVYQGVKPGKVILTASGDPVCRSSQPPCAMPSILFSMTIFVK